MVGVSEELGLEICEDIATEDQLGDPENAFAPMMTGYIHAAFQGIIQDSKGVISYCSR